MVSNLVSNARHPPASAIPPPRDTVDRPDLRLIVVYRQVDGFDCAGGHTICVSTRSWCGNTPSFSQKKKTM